ncbi:MAG: hypothetical protein KME09_11655 [Pleurocapsa minor HA4230-MV1]|jgi:serine/threonine protein kinase|nr:hypothetical protein [Pleurocapsa minor HA4230-MV1]
MQSKNISGTIICDRYKIINVLGKGGVGITYPSFVTFRGKRVAEKGFSHQENKQKIDS